MSKLLNIALLQLETAGLNQDDNLSRGVSACKEAAEKGAHIALFPEMWNVGYSLLPDKPFHEAAITSDSEFVSTFASLANELDMAIAISFLESWPERPRNTMVLFDRNGKNVLTYAKVHTCAFSKEAHCTPGEEFPVVSLETPIGDIKVGAMICFDREFPESARVMALAGAEVILVPNACELEINRLTQCRSRAFENMVTIAVANYPQPSANGNSVIYDGMAFGTDEKSRDMTVVQGDENESVLIGSVDLDALRDYRQREVWKDEFRRPEAYANLV